MEKIFKTTAYGPNSPLRIKTSNSIFYSGPEVKAKVNTETGEVTFFIDEDDLEELKDVD
ncbi:hypothetical protein SAMN02745245_01229 [Anaerosphaera aminiphila DSM 21120]|uniref:Uncharacterized protein n=1 Tax=Anaerosphaera aminiphila DSM 21120 TaxID=1120995 RepID=A0A1M5SNQ1_9FIRM|nr:Clp protease [Anaerosphaera aminiphila]SHH40126.1 hypothetical protein SAMN02745245_01229 [Anaerosphaera aminiphila DSM 21120]